MVAVRTALAGALVVLTGVLAALSALVGLSGPSWAVGALCGVILTGAVARAVGPAGGHELGPADLVTLARTPIVVVCAGVKSILDVGATLERLETLGVAVAGYRSTRFGGFFVTDGGFDLDWALDSPEQVAADSVSKPRIPWVR